MKPVRGDALVTPSSGLFRADGGVRGLTYARAPASGRRGGGIGIQVRNQDGVWLKTQLSVDRRDFYALFVDAARHVAKHGGLEFNERVLRPRMREAAEQFLRRYGLRTERVCYWQATEAGTAGGNHRQMAGGIESAEEPVGMGGRA